MLKFLYYYKKTFLNIRMDSEYIGAVKIKDGLFTGDKETSQDLDFIVSSKVTHIINTSKSEVNDE